MQNNFRKTYITWFLILVLPPILLRLGIASGDIALSEDFAVLLIIITKVGVIILTIWYGLKIGIKNVWAWALGLVTLFPFMVWIFVVILLTRKAGSQTTLLKTSEGRLVLSHEKAFNKSKEDKYDKKNNHINIIYNQYLFLFIS